MKISKLLKKVLKIGALLLLIRIGLFIPVPGLALDIFSQNGVMSPQFGFIKNLTGSSFLGIGSLGIIPFLNASVVIQFLTYIVPSLERVQKEEGEFGRKKLKRYTRYLTFGFSIGLSACVAIFVVKPIVFGCDLWLEGIIIASLTIGSILSMWFAEIITEEKLGNGSSMVIFINIIGGLPKNFHELGSDLQFSIFGNKALTLFLISCMYFLMVAITIYVCESYKRVDVISAKQLVFRVELDNNYLPIKLNLGGIMPLVFSTAVTQLLIGLVQYLLYKTLALESGQLPILLSFTLNLILVIVFSTLYGLLVLNPTDVTEKLNKASTRVPGVKPGKETKKYLTQLIIRLAMMGGFFLAFVILVSFLLGSVLQLRLFSNLTSLVVLVGVISDVTEEVNGYLISQSYDNSRTV